MKKMIAVIVATPILALFLGIGVMALSIADTWDERNTDVMISNISVICGIGGLAFALVLASIVGIVLITRLSSRDRAPTWRESGRTLKPPVWLESPPLLPDSTQSRGRLYSNGPSAYEDLDQTLFGGDNPTPSDWEENS